GLGFGEELVLKDVSVQVRAGETVALVGESGGGKTTFANLIPRFYEVSSGSVKLDGVDVKDYAKAELRRRVALVPQMPVLFRGTIEENILMGKPGASREEVEQAAKQAFAHDFILKQEKGYETDVSEKGSSLSGGQRQRIAIARAFLKDAPVLIMDEATSALDAQSEGKVQEAIRELAKERTTILITHRESTKEFADRVLRFEKGVVDEG
ncbi:MAG: ATP-binding cassette domain-containing protein, partial [Verrucomicrobiota bacterium]